MDNLGKTARAWLVAGALALSVSTFACSSSSGNNGTGGSSGTGGASSTGGSTGAGGTTGGMGGMVSDGGSDVPVTGSGGMTGSGGKDGGTDTGPSTDPHAVHLGIINATTTTGMPVNRPAPSISYDMCKI